MALSLTQAECHTKKPNYHRLRIMLLLYLGNTDVTVSGLLIATAWPYKTTTGCPGKAWGRAQPVSMQLPGSLQTVGTSRALVASSWSQLAILSSTYISGSNDLRGKA